MSALNRFHCIAFRIGFKLDEFFMKNTVHGMLTGFAQILKISTFSKINLKKNAEASKNRVGSQRRKAINFQNLGLFIFLQHKKNLKKSLEKKF